MGPFVHRNDIGTVEQKMNVGEEAGSDGNWWEWRIDRLPTSFFTLASFHIRLGTRGVVVVTRVC